MPPPGGLARNLTVGLGQLVVGDGPNTFDAAAGAQEESGRSQRHERHEQGVLDEVLPLFVLPEVHNTNESLIHALPRSALPATTPLMARIPSLRGALPSARANTSCHPGGSRPAWACRPAPPGWVSSRWWRRSPTVDW